MSRLLVLLALMTGFFLVGGPPCTSVPALIAASQSHNTSAPCLCGLNPEVIQQTDSTQPQIAPTAGPQETSSSQEENHDLVSVQLWVFALAAVVAALGLLGYLMRRALGLEQLPPPEDGPSHH